MTLTRPTYIENLINFVRNNEITWESVIPNNRMLEIISTNTERIVSVNINQELGRLRIEWDTSQITTGSFARTLSSPEYVQSMRERILIGYEREMENTIARAYAIPSQDLRNSMTRVWPASFYENPMNTELSSGPGNWPNVRSALCPLLLSIDNNCLYGPYSNQLYTHLSPFLRSGYSVGDGVYHLKFINDRLLQSLTSWSRRHVYLEDSLSLRDIDAFDGVDTFRMVRLSNCYHLSHGFVGRRTCFSGNLFAGNLLATVNVCIATTADSISEGPFRTLATPAMDEYVSYLRQTISNLIPGTIRPRWNTNWDWDSSREIAVPATSNEPAPSTSQRQGLTRKIR